MILDISLLFFKTMVNVFSCVALQLDNFVSFIKNFISYVCYIKWNSQSSDVVYHGKLCRSFQQRDIYVLSTVAMQKEFRTLTCYTCLCHSSSVSLASCSAELCERDTFSYA